MSNDLDEPLDLPMTVGNRFVRLVTTADGDVTALFVGAVAGASEVWVRLVDEEALLLEGGQSSRPAEILIGVRNCPDEARSHVGDVIRLSKAASVHVEPRADHVSPAVISRPLKAKPRVRRRWATDVVDDRLRASHHAWPAGDYSRIGSCVNRRAPGSGGSRREFTR